MLKQFAQSLRLWSIINQFNPTSKNPLKLHEILAIALILEERIELATHHAAVLTNTLLPATRFISLIIGEKLSFYSQPELHPKQVKFSLQSLTNNLLSEEQ